MRKELGKVEVEGDSDKNLVKIVLTGQHELKKLTIDPNLLQESKETIESSIIAAYKDARAKVEGQVKQKMKEEL